MRSLALVFFVLFLATACTAVSSIPAQDAQKSPQGVIKLFFNALHTNDVETIKLILSPGRFDAYNKFGVWEDWLSVWRQCNPTEIGEIRARYAQSKYDESVSVRVKYVCVNRPPFTNWIVVSRINDKWYWDEN